MKRENATTRLLSGIVCAVALAAFGFSQQPEAPAACRTVHVIKLESVISPVSAEFITTSITKAEDENAECLMT